MTEPRKVTRLDPAEYCDQGSKGRGMMERDTDGDYVEYEDYRALEIETQELAEALEDMLFYMPDDEMRESARAALARHRAKQEVGK